MKPLVLYSTDDCALCDSALEVLLSMPELGGRALRVVDVVHDAALIEVFGSRLPVLACPAAGAELDWPFSAATVSAWLVQIE